MRLPRAERGGDAASDESGDAAPIGDADPDAGGVGDVDDPFPDGTSPS